MTEVQQWKESAATIFLQKDSTLTLLEVIFDKFEICLETAMIIIKIVFVPKANQSLKCM